VKGQRIGYVRVSTFDQNVDRQLEGQSLDAAGGRRSCAEAMMHKHGIGR